jgi:hypothetical protein
MTAPRNTVTGHGNGRQPQQPRGPWPEVEVPWVSQLLEEHAG